jgi:hypothetical protein
MLRAGRSCSLSRTGRSSYTRSMAFAGTVLSVDTKASTVPGVIGTGPSSVLCPALRRNLLHRRSAEMFPLLTFPLLKLLSPNAQLLNSNLPSIRLMGSSTVTPAVSP